MERVGAVAPVRGHGYGPPGSVLRPDDELALDEVSVRGHGAADRRARRRARGFREVVQIVVILNRFRGRAGLDRSYRSSSPTVRSRPRGFPRVKANDRGVQAEALILAWARLVACGAVATAAILRRGHRRSRRSCVGPGLPSPRLPRVRVKISNPEIKSSNFIRRAPENESRAEGARVWHEREPRWPLRCGGAALRWHRRRVCSRSITSASAKRA